MTTEPLTMTACPKCGGRDLKISAVQYITAYVGFTGSGSDEDHDVTDTGPGDIEWGDDSHTICSQCGHESELRDFVLEGGEEESITHD